MALTANVPKPGLDLQYPMSLGVYEDYPRAQRVVDYLSDNEFEVQHMAIVGTELKTIERVTGRLTRRKVGTAGAVSGLWMGLFVGLAFALFGQNHPLSSILVTIGFGVLFGFVWSQLGFAAITRGGTRDFSSFSQVVATRYEVLVEHRFAERAREMLLAMPAV